MVVDDNFNSWYFAKYHVTQEEATRDPALRAVMETARSAYMAGIVHATCLDYSKMVGT